MIKENLDIIDARMKEIFFTDTKKIIISPTNDNSNKYGNCEKCGGFFF